MHSTKRTDAFYNALTTKAGIRRQMAAPEETTAPKFAVIKYYNRIQEKVYEMVNLIENDA